jgi:hypothetical protein
MTLPVRQRSQEKTQAKKELRARKQKDRKQKQKVKATLFKRESQEATTLSYLNQTWTTKMFAHAEIPSEQLSRKFHRWIQRYTGIRKELQRFDRWTQTNLEMADISGVTRVLIPLEHEYNLPKKVQLGKMENSYRNTDLERRRWETQILEFKPPPEFTGTPMAHAKMSDSVSDGRKKTHMAVCDGPRGHNVEVQALVTIRLWTNLQ